MYTIDLQYLQHILKLLLLNLLSDDSVATMMDGFPQLLSAFNVLIMSLDLHQLSYLAIFPFCTFNFYLAVGCMYLVISSSTIVCKRAIHIVFSETVLADKLLVVFVCIQLDQSTFLERLLSKVCSIFLSKVLMCIFSNLSISV